MTSFVLQVQTLLRDVTYDEMEAKFLSVVNSLMTAQDAKSLAGWGIVWGDRSQNSPLTSVDIEKISQVTLAAGGKFSYVTLEPHIGRAEAQNSLAGLASDENFLLFLDHDIVVAPDTIHRMIQSLRPQVGIVDARCIPIEKTKLFDHETGSTPWAWGGCLLASAAVFQEVGGFDENILPDEGGDIDLSQRIRLAGHDVVHQPSARAFCGDRFGPEMDLLADERKQTANSDSAHSAHRPKAPFLSVVIRTQGNRLELLGDALVCLAGQTSGNFEIIIVQHSTVDDAGVRALVESQAPFLRDRIGVRAVVGGKRGVPLNVGIAAATGLYVAFFDDDDLVSTGWVESFLAGAALSPGAVQRSQVATLRSKPTMWPGNPNQGFESVGTPVAEYARSFSQVDHLLVSHTPFMSLAFPRDLFGEGKITFDETLWVCEDWDVLLQASSVAGVNDVDELTAFYRRWSGLDNSYTEHHAEQWRESEARVVDRIRSHPFALHGMAVDRIRELLMEETELHAARQLLAEQGLVLGSMSWKVTAPLRWTKALLSKAMGTSKNS